jgi:hypothetical protein
MLALKTFDTDVSRACGTEETPVKDLVSMKVARYYVLTENLSVSETPT